MNIAVDDVYYRLEEASRILKQGSDALGSIEIEFYGYFACCVMLLMLCCDGCDACDIDGDRKYDNM